MPPNSDTIFALASGSGKAGVAVIRVSGKGLDFLPKTPKPRHAHFMNFHDIDNLIAVYFPAPDSFTGEDVIELHCHGGPAVIAAIFQKLSEFGFRHAEKGEFSYRAFKNGKMDLTEVDSLRALVDARTEAQRRRALAGFAGGDSTAYARWRADMIELAALSSARMDYDSADLPKDINARIKDKCAALRKEIAAALASKARIIESGFNIVLAGAPNVGKSSLFNRLLGESRAIVSDIAGTTRDVVSAELDIDGFLVRLSDTAGLCESDDKIEKMGIEKTREQLESADLILRVFAGPADLSAPAENEIAVINKSDLIESRIPDLVYVSAKTGEGIDNLLDIIKGKIHERLDGLESDLSVSDRARTLLANAVVELEKAADKSPDLAAEHIMFAADEIGRILGIIGLDEIYDSVFGQLCLGK